jgi:dephospho-CoA kinase
MERLGARIFHADDVGKRVLEDDPGARAEIIAAFGERSYGSDGALNRAFLADRVFGDDEAVDTINRIVHPRVAAAFDAVRIEATRDGTDILVKEAALIFESGGDKSLDAVIVVDAPESERIRRTMKRDGLTESQVRARIRHQLPPDELRRRADWILDNSRTLEDLQDTARRVLGEVLERFSS